MATFTLSLVVNNSGVIKKYASPNWRNCPSHSFHNATILVSEDYYDSIPLGYIPDNQLIVILPEPRYKLPGTVKSYKSLLEAIKHENKHMNVLGDNTIIREILTRYSYLIDSFHLIHAIHPTTMKSETDKLLWSYLQHTNVRIIASTDNYIEKICTWHKPPVHEEYQYLEIMKEICRGMSRCNRTNVRTYSSFGQRMEFSLLDNTIPILTTKRVFYRGAIEELLWMLRGSTDTHELEAKGITYWQGNTSPEFLASRGLSWTPGSIGPGYGFQWRHWNAPYQDITSDYTDKGIDQLQELIKGLREDPYSRRHILTNWNVGQLDQMALPPCHMMCQFYVSDDNEYLDCQLYQRSGDMFLGVPFNIVMYSVLTAILAKLTERQPRKLIIVLGDAHVYTNHTEQVYEQCRRVPLPFPKLRLADITSVDDIVYERDIKIEGYQCWPGIKAPLAV
jgi:thymidylate synthase